MHITSHTHASFTPPPTTAAHQLFTSHHHLVSSLHMYTHRLLAVVFMLDAYYWMVHSRRVTERLSSRSAQLRATILYVCIIGGHWLLAGIQQHSQPSQAKHSSSSRRSSSQRHPTHHTPFLPPRSFHLLSHIRAAGRGRSDRGERRKPPAEPIRLPAPLCGRPRLTRRH